jgi:hypothetical protein
MAIVNDDFDIQSELERTAAAESASRDMYLNSRHELLCMMVSHLADTNDDDDA